VLQDAAPHTHLGEIFVDDGQKITVERNGSVALIGLNRPEAQNLVDPEMHGMLSRAYFQFEHDDALRCAVLFGHGDSFCKGIDVEAFAPVIDAHSDRKVVPESIDPWGKAKPRLTKPVIVVAHGQTWNIGHELFLAADIRIAASNTVFAQTEATHGRLPASGSTIRLVHEAGWAQAMRYLLTGDSWTAAQAERMGTVQQVCDSPADALACATSLADKVAACAPLSIKATLASAHLAIDSAQDPAFAALPNQRSSLYASHDFEEGLRAAKEHRRPVFSGT
jgi:enoyl-CoA hydratase/carnithine racemase